MDLTQMEECLELTTSSSSKAGLSSYVNLEAEIPEELYKGMKAFISNNPHWDQYLSDDCIWHMRGIQRLR